MEVYEEVEHLLSLSECIPREKAYLMMKARLNDNVGDYEFMWRLARTTHLYVETLIRSHVSGHHKKLQFEAKEYALQALRLNPDDPNVHQWCAQTIGGTTRFVSIGEKILIGFQYKEHIDKAIDLKPKDARLRHLRGRFCFEVASLSWIERKFASLLYTQPPSATYDDALTEFIQAENVAPNTSVDNLLQIAKCFIAKGDRDSAIQYLRKAEKVKSVTPEDVTAAKEVKLLLTKR